MPVPCTRSPPISTGRGTKPVDEDPGHREQEQLDHGDVRDHEPADGRAQVTHLAQVDDQQRAASGRCRSPQARCRTAPCAPQGSSTAHALRASQPPGCGLRRRGILRHRYRDLAEGQVVAGVATHGDVAQHGTRHAGRAQVQMADVADDPGEHRQRRVRLRRARASARTPRRVTPACPRAPVVDTGARRWARSSRASATGSSTPTASTIPNSGSSTSRMSQPATPDDSRSRRGACRPSSPTSRTAAPPSRTAGPAGRSASGHSSSVVSRATRRASASRQRATERASAIAWTALSTSTNTGMSPASLAVGCCAMTATTGGWRSSPHSVQTRRAARTSASEVASTGGT